MGSREEVFTYGAPRLKFGNGASDEIGFDLAEYGARRVLVVTDPGVAATGAPARIAERIAGIRTGDGRRPGCDMGPLVTRAHRDRVAFLRICWGRRRWRRVRRGSSYALAQALARC